MRRTTCSSREMSDSVHGVFPGICALPKTGSVNFWQDEPVMIASRCCQLAKRFNPTSSSKSFGLAKAGNSAPSAITRARFCHKG